MQTMWERRGSALYPVDPGAQRLFNKLQGGQRFVADAKDPTNRSGEQHRFWFALAHALFDNQSRYDDFESFRARLLVYLGYCEKIETQEGDLVAMPKSLKFGKMPADEFGALVDSTLNFAESLGWNRDELLAQTREMAC